MFKRNGSLVLLASFVVLLFAANAGADDEMFLGYSFTEDYSQSYKVKANQEVESGGFAFSLIMDAEVTEKCVSVSDDGFMMELTFDKVEASRMQFDNMTEDPLGASLMGNTVTFTVDKFGETSDLKPVGLIDGWSRIQQVVKPMIDSWYPYLPNETAAKGHSWTHADKSDEGSSLVVEGSWDFEFDDIKKEKGAQCARIKAKGGSKISGVQETPMGAMKADGETKGDLELYFCTKTSRIIKYKARHESRMDLTPESGGDSTEAIVIVSMEREVS